MGLELAPLVSAHLDTAAELWIARYQTERKLFPELRADAAHPRRVADVLSVLLQHPDTSGVGAWLSGQLVGFLVGELGLVPPTAPEALWSRPRALRIRYQGHAAPSREGLLRELYGALAARWVKRGVFVHYAVVPAAERESSDAFFSLGFGQEIAGGVRDVSPLARVTLRPDLELSQVGAEGLEDLLRMNAEMDRHATESPGFAPFLPETRSGYRQWFAKLLAEPGTGLFFALQKGQPVGFALVHPAAAAGETELGPECLVIQRCFVSPDLRGSGAGRGLVDRVMAYARLKGYARCSLRWRSSHLVSDRFWRRCGFRPYQFRLARVVDERALWSE
jgi:GNAT superfamily N-acetyltransferase